MLNNRSRVFAPAVIMLWGVCAVPSVAASQVCVTTIDGRVQCTTYLPYGARFAIGASILGSILLGFTLFFFLRGRRSRQQEIAQVYQVEASQVQGPSTYVTSFDPRTADHLQTPGIVVNAAPESAPANEQYPKTQERYARRGIRPPQTAPVNQGHGGGYPFPGYSPNRTPTAQPYTAFSRGFPRPLYTGHPVHKEGPPEIHKDVV